MKPCNVQCIVKRKVGWSNNVQLCIAPYEYVLHTVQYIRPSVLYYAAHPIIDEG